MTKENKLLHQKMNELSINKNRINNRQQAANKITKLIEINHKNISIKQKNLLEIRKIEEIEKRMERARSKKNKALQEKIFRIKNKKHVNLPVSSINSANNLQILSIEYFN